MPTGSAKNPAAASSIGFENHGGRTRLGASLTPLGTVLRGHGNNGEDGTEGVRYKNVYGTYSHGPLLPKNPALCDEILRGALRRKYGAGRARASRRQRRGGRPAGHAHKTAHSLKGGHSLCATMNRNSKTAFPLSGSC